VISIFAHLPNTIRNSLYPRVERCLEPRGSLLLEAYSESQLSRSTGASCTGFVAGIVGVAPGRGVIVAQARSNGRSREHGVRMIRDGASQQSVVTAVANAEFDPAFQEQQYGVAALGFEDSPAVFTGSETPGWQGHATADGVAVQGSILTGPEVVQATLEAFQENRPQPLAERLLLALEAGGDRRCGKQRALSAYLVVARSGDPEDSLHVRIVVPGQWPGGPSPVRMVRERFDGAILNEELGMSHVPREGGSSFCLSISSGEQR